MEAERRSTMSSLKGQLSNVEGSVKSMKAAVVVGSVLTVACLAAVFGVTVAANEVSKEVKVNNGVLATKAGKSVLTTSTTVVSKPVFGASKFTTEGLTVAINAQVQEGAMLTTICDDIVIVSENGENEAHIIEGSVLESVLNAEEQAEKRSASIHKSKFIRRAAKLGRKLIGGPASWAVDIAIMCVDGTIDCKPEYVAKTYDARVGAMGGR